MREKDKARADSYHIDAIPSIGREDSTFTPGMRPGLFPRRLHTHASIDSLSAAHQLYVI